MSKRKVKIKTTFKRKGSFAGKKKKSKGIKIKVTTKFKTNIKKPRKPRKPQKDRQLIPDKSFAKKTKRKTKIA